MDFSGNNLISERILIYMKRMTVCFTRGKNIEFDSKARRITSLTT